MSDNKKIVYSIIKFLRDELTSLSSEACESIEVAIQCLENAYEIHFEDPSLDTGTPLTRIFASQLSASTPYIPQRIATAAEKEEAERLKNEGNNLVKSDKYEEAVQCYTKAIQLDPNNPIYYCNRAAAHSRLGNHHATIDDCKAALRIEPTYGKAYGRLGYAYSSLNMFHEAQQSYQKALEIEPGNQNYINNLELNEGLKKMAHDNANNLNTNNVNGVDTRPTLDGFDLSSFIGDPAILYMASQMMADPSMRNMMSSLVSENLNENSSGMEALMQVGQRVAQHMQSTNPDLVEQLRQQMANSTAAQNLQNSQNAQNQQQKKN